MWRTPKLISIVDDDESVREGLSRLLISAGFAVNTFASAEKYLSSDQPGRTDCLLLDVRMPGNERHRAPAPIGRQSF